MINHIITSSLVIVFVMLIGKMFETKINARLKYSLWLLVVVKLLVPFSDFESPLHVLNFIGTFADNNMSNESEQTIVYGLEEEILTEEAGAYQESDSIEKKNSGIIRLSVLIMTIYFAGVITCLGVFLISNIRFYKKFKSKSKYLKIYKDKIPVYQIEDYYGACLYGGFSPVIIVGNNKDLTIEQQHMVMLHEYVHYTHGDHIWSVIRGLCVALYWCNPLVWLAAFASRNDGELACDEGVIRHIGKNQRIAYGQTLLEILSKSSRKNDIMSVVFLNFTTATGGIEEMKKRISMIAKGRKTSSIALILTIVLSVVCVGCTFGKPVDETATTAVKEFEIMGEDEVKGTDSSEDSQEIELMGENTDAASETVLVPDVEVNAENKQYVWPTVSNVISTTFGERVHPITGEKKVVDYIGIAGEEGDSVYAVADGDIMDVGFDNTLGNYIVLTTITGEEVTYGHLYGSKVPKGAQVKAGEIIGLLGKTGNATGAFLSISVVFNGEAVDPMLFLKISTGEKSIR